jgi:hypothetical protein
LDTVRVVETEDRNPKVWKISHFPMHHTMLLEKGCCFVEFSAVSDVKAEMIQPYTVRTKMSKFIMMSC